MSFLRTGGGNWPGSLRSRYSALAAWRGISHFKDSLKRLTGAAPESHVLLANRSAMLMKLAARMLHHRCRSVLFTDLSWPGYLRILRRQRKPDENSLHGVWLRKRILMRKLPSDEVIDLLVGAFVHYGCDGLFLPLVDHMGVRLPAREIIREIRRRAELRFVVVDGAQALAHVPLQLAEDDYDFFIAGCHKWLGAQHPLGLGFFGKLRSMEYVRRSVRYHVDHHVVDDPLLRFSEELENGGGSRFGETVNVTPLLTAQGAVDDCDPGRLSGTFVGRIDNADRLLSRMRGPHWKPCLPDPAFRSGIVMLQGQGERRTLPADDLRRMLHEQGIAASTYHGGLVRLSMPNDPWPAEHLDHLARFFRGR
jgi:hypothetical protein